MELYQVRYFLAVAETGSFTKGAERSFVSQPTLSAGIRKLETDLGTRLFNRAGRRISLTEAGQRFLGRARTIMAEVSAARTEASTDGSRTVIRLGILPSLPSGPLASMVAEFDRTTAGSALRLREGSPDDLEARLQHGNLDAALTILPSEDSATVRGLRSSPLLRSHLLLASSEANPLARRDTLDLGQLDGTPFILRTHCEFLTESRRVFDAHKVRPRVVYRTDRDDRALALAAAGLGVTIVPDRLRVPGLAYMRIRELDISRQIGLRWRADIDSPALETLRHVLQGEDWSGIAREEGPARRRFDWAH
jgi:DNA-binding transcriptional LysR family regulator